MPRPLTPPAFTLDTSGTVQCPGTPCICHARFWEYLSPFAQGYVEAMLWDVRDLDRLTDMEPVAGDPPRVGPYWIAFRDLAPETLARIIADCEAFASRWAPADHSSGAQRRNGALFWSHRVAEWDAFPPLTVTLGDDGKVRFG